MLKALLGPITGLARTFLEGRQRKQELEKALHKKRLETVHTKSVAEAEMEVYRVKSLMNSWKDEFVTVVIVFPAILAFCGDWGAQTVSEGFKALQTTPDWYQYLLIAVVSVGAGIPLGGKALSKYKKEKQ